MKNPCYKCEQRQPGCHGICTEGIEYSKHAKDQRERVKAEKSRETMYLNFKIKQVIDTKHKAGMG